MNNNLRENESVFVKKENSNYKAKNKVAKKYVMVAGILIVAIIVVIALIFMQKDKTENINNDNNSIIDVDNNKENKNEVKVIDVDSKTRPYAVMINCHNSSLPQAGLDKAYIVYEIMVEFGITRMMALYKDVDVDKIGSIRSARNQYLAYVFENDAIYVHAGGQAETIERISNEKIADIDVDGKYGFRDKTLKRDYEHTLFTSTSLLSKGMSNKKLRSTTEKANLLNYSADELDLSKYQTTSAENVSIKYSNYRTSNYKYDSISKTYLRSMNSKDNIDLVTGEQYQVKNIIAYSVKHTTYTAHGYYGYQKLDNIGSGEGFYITNGLALPITWSKKDESSQTIYKISETGEELVVNDGNTYIQIYPTNGKLIIS